MTTRRYRKLEVWELAMDLAVATYAWTDAFPREERYGLTAQIRRAVVSIACNIAEGQGRAQPGEFLNQLSVARGSLHELETLFTLSERLKFLRAESAADALERCDRISRMLTGLRRSIAARAGNS